MRERIRSVVVNIFVLCVYLCCFVCCTRIGYMCCVLNIVRTFYYINQTTAADAGNDEVAGGRIDGSADDVSDQRAISRRPIGSSLDRLINDVISL